MERPTYRSILIVEDEETLRRVIARNLTARGIRVREVETAEAALAALRAERPDLLLLDINLPDRTGWDVLRETRRLGLDVPTIVVSAVRVGASRLDEFQPLAYLPKPFPLEALLALVVGREQHAVGEPALADSIMSVERDAESPNSGGGLADSWALSAPRSDQPSVIGSATSSERLERTHGADH